MYVCVCARVCAFVSVHYSLGYRLLLSPWELIREKLWLKRSRAGPFLFHDCHFRFSRHPIFSLSLSLCSTYILYTAARMFGKCFSTVQRRHRASYEFPMQGTRIMRVEAREEREISIGIFLLESLPEDDDGMTRFVEDYRGRNSRPIPRCGTRFYIFSIDTLSWSGEEGDANIWKTIYSGKRWILSINIIARSRIFGLRRKNFSREIFASFLIPGFFFNSSEFFEIFFSYPPPLNCLNSWWNIIIIETWISTLPGSSFSCSSLVPVCLCLAKGICERTDWNAKSKRTDRECVWLIVNCWLEQLVSYETTEDRRRARNRDLHHGNIDIVVCSREERFR